MQRHELRLYELRATERHAGSHLSVAAHQNGLGFEI